MFPCLSVINTKRLVAARFQSDSSLDLKTVKRTPGEQFSLPVSDQKKTILDIGVQLHSIFLCVYLYIVSNKLLPYHTYRYILSLCTPPLSLSLIDSHSSSTTLAFSLTHTLSCLPCHLFYLSSLSQF